MNKAWFFKFRITNKSPKIQFFLLGVFILCLGSCKEKKFKDNFDVQIHEISVLKDVSRKKSFSKVEQLKFTSYQHNLVNLGFGTEADWVKILLKNKDSTTVSRILRIAKPLQDSISFFSKVNGKYQVRHSGVMVQEKNKILKGSSIYFPFVLKPKESKTVYLRVVSKYGKSFDLTIEDQSSYIQKEKIELIIVSILIGALLTIGIYNIFLGLGLKDSTYGLYGLLCFGSLFTQLTVRAVPKQLFGIANRLFLEWFPPFIIAISVMLALMFCIRFLNTKKYSRTADFALKGLLILEPCFFLYEFIRMEVFGMYTTNGLVASGVMILGIFALYAGITCYRNGNRFALYFIYAWLAFCLGMIVYVGTLFTIIPINTITSNIYLLGSIMEVSLLSFALASRYRQSEREKYVLSSNLQLKEMELTNKKEEVISLMNESVEHLKSKVKLANNLKKLAKEEGVNLKSILADLKSKELEDSKLLLIRKNISDINFEFLRRLKKLHPNLSKTDLEICSFFLIDLTRNEIANLRNTTLHAVKASRARIKKKLNLDSKVFLDDYIKRIGQETKSNIQKNS
ncbi:7TM diverse intracellular signaling domain-containing protein [Mariniflexile sp. HMF6888]|uniref:7TM diverse intracellular signaling domain-containing protein n=1 Tax=Mariniflexile sp. HMF6888 TaxID=3373086 RepID=UPI0037AEF705